MIAIASIESRNWLPRYRVMIIHEDGTVLAVRTFWFKRNARLWILEGYEYQKHRPDVS